MSLKFRTGKLARIISERKPTIVPYSETIQHVELTRLADGTYAESNEYIQAEKDRILEGLRSKYGEVDDSQITWVMVHKSGQRAV